jgi:hypothetical protein
VARRRGACALAPGWHGLREAPVLTVAAGVTIVRQVVIQDLYDV